MAETQTDRESGTGIRSLDGAETEGKIAQRPGSGRNRSETGTRETRFETGMETGQGGDSDKGTEPIARDSD